MLYAIYTSIATTVRQPIYRACLLQETVGRNTVRRIPSISNIGPSFGNLSSIF